MKIYILILLLTLINFPAFAQGSWKNSTDEKEKIESELKIYPNPCTNSKVTIDFNANEISEISFTNITGKQILLKKYEFPPHKTQIQLYNIPNGIYLIRVKTSDKKMVVKKLMVSKN